MSTTNQDPTPKKDSTSTGTTIGTSHTTAGKTSTEVDTPPPAVELDPAKLILSQDPALVIIQLGDDYETIQQLRDFGTSIVTYADASLKQLSRTQRGGATKRKNFDGTEDRPITNNFNPNKRKHKANWKLIQECKDKLEEQPTLPNFRAYLEQMHQEFSCLNTSNTPQYGCVDVTTKRKTQCLCMDMFISTMKAKNDDPNEGSATNITATADPESNLAALLDCFVDLRKEGIDRTADDFYPKCHAILANHLHSKKITGRGLRDPMFYLKKSKEPKKHMFCMRTLQNALGFEDDKAFYERCLKRFGDVASNANTPLTDADADADADTESPTTTGRATAEGTVPL